MFVFVSVLVSVSVFVSVFVFVFIPTLNFLRNIPRGGSAFTVKKLKFTLESQNNSFTSHGAN